MKIFLYTILACAIIPATQLLFLTFLLLYITIQNAEFSVHFFLAITSIICSICGYIGLLTLFKGLNKTNHYKKIVLLLAGLLGFAIFMGILSPRNFVDWLFESGTESLIMKIPLAVNIIFLASTAFDLFRKKRQVYEK